MLTDEQLREIRGRADAATPGPWGYNSYSRVDAGAFIANYDNPDAPDYPDGSRPGSQPGHKFFDEVDNAWLAQRHAAYEADPEVASVPAEYGDTATGRHANDAEFIAYARTDVPRLLDEIDRLRDGVRNMCLDHVIDAAGCPGCGTKPPVSDSSSSGT